MHQTTRLGIRSYFNCLRNEGLLTLGNYIKSGFIYLLATVVVWNLPSGGFLHSECALWTYRSWFPYSSINYYNEFNVKNSFSAGSCIYAVMIKAKIVFCAKDHNYYLIFERLCELLMTSFVSFCNWLTFTLHFSSFSAVFFCYGTYYCSTNSHLGHWCCFSASNSGQWLWTFLLHLIWFSGLVLLEWGP